MSVLPSQLVATLDTLDSLIGSSGYVAAGRAGLGVFLVALRGAIDEQARAIEGLRSKLPVGQGSAVIVRSSAELRARADVWGPIGDGLPLMRAVKHQFDPSGILNPGRGPGNL